MVIYHLKAEHVDNIDNRIGSSGMAIRFLFSTIRLQNKIVDRNVVCPFTDLIETI